jgi:hypothetical protein
MPVMSTETPLRESTATISPWPPPWRDDEMLLRYADLTLAEFFRQLARYGNGARIEEQDGLVLFAGSHPQPNPFRNGALCLDHRLSANEALERARGFFAPLHRGFVFWVRDRDPDLDRLCDEQGLSLLEPEGLPEMALEGPPPPVRELPDNVELRRVTDCQTRADYLSVVADGWGMGALPPELAADIFFHPDSVAEPNVIAFVAYQDNKPASGSMALLTYGIAVGGQGATVSWARRQGLAEACYAACLDVAYNDYGIRGSVCQSSPSGDGVWTRMGYREITRYKRYLCPPATPSA